MDKQLFKKYEKWCVENNKDPLTEESIAEFRNFRCEESKKRLDEVLANIRADKMKKQKEIFSLITAYVGSSVEYDEDIFDAFENLMKGIVSAVIIKASNEKLDEKLELIEKGE